MSFGEAGFPLRRCQRWLCKEVHLDLACRQFCRLGRKMPIRTPRHSRRTCTAVSATTTRFVFEKVLERCLAEGLVGGEGCAIHASVITAHANRQRDMLWVGPAE